MADPDKIDRTWLCSVLFMDIARYSSQSVELQMKWKIRFNGYLAEAIHDVPESDRVILDTGDGAAICFLGAPEAAMFAALQLCRSFTLDEKEQQPGLRVRLGINLGPVRLIRDINGALNAIGDGLNAGQRIMSFAPENQILVSQSFYEVVGCLSDDYKRMFQLKGVETDKHVREHTVYYLSAKPAATSAMASPKPAPLKRPWIPVLMGGILLAAALGAWRIHGSSAAPAPTPKPAEYQPPQIPVPDPAPAVIKTPAVRTAPAAKVAAPQPSSDAKAADDDSIGPIDNGNPTEAVRRFDDAVRANPNDVDAYVGRAEARRKLLQYDLSLQDCNKVIQLRANDPRGYNCRGFGHQLLKQFEAALPDFNEAIRLNPNFILAYEHRGTTYEQLQQYDRAVQDYSAALRLAPRNALFYVRRGGAYSYQKRYDLAIRDLTEAIRLQPTKNAYRLRALAEEASGDTAGAAADRDRMKESPKKKK